MRYIDPLRHSLLHLVSQEAQKWLQFIRARGALQHYLPRLRGPAPKRDEALAEIGVAYFLEFQCGLPIQKWEPRGANGRRGEFLVGDGPEGPIFVEVKSPGWEAEIAKAEGQASPRLLKPKYIDAEGRWTAPWASVRHAVAKAYPKMPDSIPTLLIINDDLMVPLNEWHESVRTALYCERVPGYTEGCLAEDGCFVDSRYGRLGAIGILNVESVRGVVRYLFSLFYNPNALPRVAVPPTLFAGYPSCDGLRYDAAAEGDVGWGRAFQS